MLTIGEFSRICLVTKKTLRYYDEIGLLKPEYIGENGYRHYTVEQLRTMLLISRLKSYHFSLPEIAVVLDRRDNDYLAEKIREKRGDLRRELQSTRRILQQMEQDEDKLKRRIDIMQQNLNIKTVELAPQKIVCLRKFMGLKDFDQNFEALYRQAGENGLQIAGPPLTIYHDEEFNPDHSDMELGVPVDRDGKGVRELAGGLHCYGTVYGPYNENLSSAYAGIVEWIQQNGYKVSGPPHDRYVKGCADEKLDPQEYVTEVYFPISK